LAIANFEGLGLVLPQPVRSRSQLVTNQFLIALSQVFGWEAFTSRDVSNRFGLDFLNTAKRLSRMSKKPYYLLSAVRVSRAYGGYENSYTISPRGWSKISYLQGCPTPAPKPLEEGGSILLGASSAQGEENLCYPYLVLGKGTIEEYTQYSIPPEVMGGCAPVTTRQADVGRIITGLDWRFLGAETVRKIIKGSLFRNWELAFHVNGFEKLGLTPSDTFAPLYANAARYLGATNEEIIISLLARRIFELLKSLKDQRRTIELFVSEAENRTLKPESSLQEIKVQSSEEDELPHQASFLSELFIKVALLSSLTTEDYVKIRIDKILSAIMEHELSTLKRRLKRHPTAA
jgi:hypothetical protein